MSETQGDVRQMREHVKRTFGDLYGTLRFPSPEAAGSAEGERDQILERISGDTESLCGGTKFVSGSLPIGCERCVAGDWTCLFVNGDCDAGCFFCPKPRDPEAVPTSEGMAFPRVADFVAYLRVVGSRGVGISGGEPLLSLERTLAFISGIKDEFRDEVHIWLYTSGLHAKDTNLRALRSAGLDEIRFNIAAHDYSLEAVQTATGLFESVVVEIPVVPEDVKALIGLLPALADMGVRCVNLHQMWCSPWNAPALVAGGYTFLHGSHVSVMESEQAALEVLEHAVSTGARVPVHYCSSAFKQRFQTAATLRRDARLLVQRHEEITEAGLIRGLSVSGPMVALVEQCRVFEAAGVPDADYSLDPKELRLGFKASLWDAVDLETFTPRLTYEVGYRPPPEDRSDSVLEIPISAERHLRLKRSPVKILPAMSRDDQSWFRERVVEEKQGSGMAEHRVHLEPYEEIEAGLPPYD